MSFINNLWYEKSITSFILQIPLLPFSCTFNLISALRRSLYASGLKSSEGPVVPVVIVGGITAGGSGKTPSCIAIVHELKARGFNPGILSRGYKAHSKDFPLQVPINGDPNLYGDEPCLIRRETLCPVVIDPKRTRGADYLASLGVDVIVCDDGLQHYALDREVEICILDGSRMLGNGFLLPTGPLREAKWRLKTVDSIVVTGAVAHLGYFSMQLQPSSISPLNPNSTEVLKNNSQVCALAGIANPSRFVKTLEDCGFVVNKTVEIKDHGSISFEKLKDLSSKMPVIMTDKDAIKYQAKAQEHEISNVFVLHVKAKLNKQFFDDIVNKIKLSKYKVNDRIKRREKQGYKLESIEPIDSIETIKQAQELQDKAYKCLQFNQEQEKHKTKIALKKTVPQNNKELSKHFNDSKEQELLDLYKDQEQVYYPKSSNHYNYLQDSALISAFIADKLDDELINKIKNQNNSIENSHSPQENHDINNLEINNIESNQDEILIEELDNKQNKDKDIFAKANPRTNSYSPQALPRELKRKKVT